MPAVQETSGGGAPGVGRRRRVASTLAEINVVPLVDVMLVLLIIFMITAPMIQRGVDVNLPVLTRSDQLASERLFVNVPLTYKQDRIVYLGDEPIRLEALRERLRQRMEGRAEQDKDVFVRSDGGLQVQDFMDVMDELRAGGVQKVAIATRLPDGRRPRR
jgi:biopolymer transport protein ExbD